MLYFYSKNEIVCWHTNSLFVQGYRVCKYKLLDCRLLAKSSITIFFKRLKEGGN